MRSSCFALLIGMLECYCYDTAVAVVGGVGSWLGGDGGWMFVGMVDGLAAAYLHHIIMRAGMMGAEGTRILRRPRNA